VCVCVCVCVCACACISVSVILCSCALVLLYSCALVLLCALVCSCVFLCALVCSCVLSLSLSFSLSLSLPLTRARLLCTPPCVRTSTRTYVLCMLSFVGSSYFSVHTRAMPCLHKYTRSGLIPTRTDMYVHQLAPRPRPRTFVFYRLELHTASNQT
jgi:hypothetical protein